MPVEPIIPTILWNNDHIKELEMMGEESVTIVRNEEKILPLKLNYQTRVLLVMPNVLTNASLDGITGDNAGYIIRGILSDKYSYSTDGFDLVHYNLSPFSEEIKLMVDQAKLYDIIILGSHRSHVNPPQADIVKQLFKLNKKIIWIALNSPYDLLDYPDAPTYICTYGDRLPQLKGLCRLIAGEIVPSGRLPVPISSLHSFGYGISSW
jgi:beta-N-acetylhexosaminidase